MTAMDKSKIAALIVMCFLIGGLGGFFLGRYIQPPREGETIWADEWDCSRAIETKEGADCVQWTKISEKL